MISLIGHIVLAVLVGFFVNEGMYGWAAFHFCMFLSMLTLLAVESVNVKRS